MATGTIKQSSGYSVVKEGVTVYRNGNLRIVRLDEPSAWCATLYEDDRPSVFASVTGAIYNGSSYVDCIVGVNTDGTVKVTDYFGNAISNAQYSYLTPRYVVYFV